MVSLGAAQPAGLDVIAVVRDRRLRVDAPVRDTNIPSLYYCNTLSGTAGSSRIFLGHKTGTAPPHSRAQFTRELLTLTHCQVLSWMLRRRRRRLRQLPMHRALVVGRRLHRNIFSHHDVVVAIRQRCVDVCALPFPH